MAFNTDTKSIFDRYVNNILEAVTPTVQATPSIDINQRRQEMQKSRIAGRADTSTAAGQAAVAQNQANIASAAATTAAQTKANDEYFKANRFAKANQNPGLMGQPGPSTVSTGPATPVPSPTPAATPAATPSPTPAVTPSPAPTGRSEKAVQDELNAALNNKDQAKASKLFDELATVRKQTGAPNQATDLLKKYPVAGDSTSSQPGAPVQQPVAGTAQKAGVYTPDQLAAFQAAHKSTFDPNSSMDRGKMLKMLGGAPAGGAATGSSSSLPGAGMKPGQIKTPVTSTSPGGTPSTNAPVPVQRGTPANLPPGYVERQNSKLPGVLGSASNLIGRVGDTAKNIAMGTVGKVNPKPTPPKR